MAKEDTKIYKAEAVKLTSEQLHTVSGGTVSEEDYAVTKDKVCPYCSSTQIYRGKMMKNIGFTKIWREYTCRKCGNSFWHEENC